jgi:hypothetical protein
MALWHPRLDEETILRRFRSKAHSSGIGGNTRCNSSSHGGGPLNAFGPRSNPAGSCNYPPDLVLGGQSHRNRKILLGTFHNFSWFSLRYRLDRILKRSTLFQITSEQTVKCWVPYKIGRPLVQRSIRPALLLANSLQHGMQDSHRIGVGLKINSIPITRSRILPAVILLLFFTRKGTADISQSGLRRHAARVVFNKRSNGLEVLLKLREAFADPIKHLRDLLGVGLLLLSRPVGPFVMVGVSISHDWSFKHA